MIGVVVAAHGDLADALVNTAKAVVQKPVKVLAVGIQKEDDTASYEHRIKQAVQTVIGTTGVLVLTDMFGGTPSNVSLTLHQAGRVEVLTGANLPMLIKALQLCDSNLELTAAASRIKESGSRAITVASEILGVVQSPTPPVQETTA